MSCLVNAQGHRLLPIRNGFLEYSVSFPLLVGFCHAPNPSIFLRLHNLLDLDDLLDDLLHDLQIRMMSMSEIGSTIFHMIILLIDLDIVYHLFLFHHVYCLP